MRAIYWRLILRKKDLSLITHEPELQYPQNPKIIPHTGGGSEFKALSSCPDANTTRDYHLKGKVSVVSLRLMSRLPAHA